LQKECKYRRVRLIQKILLKIFLQNFSPPPEFATRFKKLLLNSLIQLLCSSHFKSSKHAYLYFNFCCGCPCCCCGFRGFTPVCFKEPIDGFAGKIAATNEYPKPVAERKTAAGIDERRFDCEGYKS